jgi:hypothetical protein
MLDWQCARLHIPLTHLQHHQFREGCFNTPEASRTKSGFLRHPFHCLLVINSDARGPRQTPPHKAKNEIFVIEGTVEIPFTARVDLRLLWLIADV